MDIFVAILVALLAAGIAYATLDISICSKVRVLRPSDPEREYESINLSRVHAASLSILVALLSFFAMYRIMQTVSNAIGICKMMIALLCMTGAACVDFREKRIPNIFPLVMAVAGIVLLALGVITQQSGAFAYVTSSFVSAIVCVVLFFIASALTHQGIGAGDIKLIGALAIVTGMVAVIGTIFYGIAACSVIAVIALLTKKMSLKQSLPFGPFLFIGYIVTVLTGNF